MPNWARRGGKVHNSQRVAQSPPSQRKGGLGLGKGIALRRRMKRIQKDTILGITSKERWSQKNFSSNI